MNEGNVRMLFGRLPNAVLHVIRIGYDETGPFRNQVIYQLWQSQSGPVGGIYLVEVEHLDPRELALYIEPGIIVSLAPPPVVKGTDQ